ncbi:MAG TPA: OsmC family protein [Chloroflexia bacterium]|nr:OsmC family protein [Chloroflexia bacterium]
MKIRARVENSEGRHEAVVSTNGQAQQIPIPPKQSGFGSAANGGELLFLALATCYCNDIYREASKRGIVVQQVEVEVEGDFGGPGEPPLNINYGAKVTADASKEEIEALMRYTDTVAEIQNSLRRPIPVTLDKVEAVTTQ